MIRLIQRRLIIPRGDTGSFFIPSLPGVKEGDIAIFSIYDALTKTTIFEKSIPVTADELEISLTHEDTVKLKPNKYLWDIKIYSEPVYDEDGILVGGTKIDSYYAAFSLPICEIREVAQNV